MAIFVDPEKMNKSKYSPPLPSLRFVARPQIAAFWAALKIEEAAINAPQAKILGDFNGKQATKWNFKAAIIESWRVIRI